MGDKIIVEIFERGHWFDKIMRWVDKETCLFMKGYVGSWRVVLFLVLINLCKKDGQSYIVEMIFLMYVSVDKIYKSSKIFTTIYIK